MFQWKKIPKFRYFKQSTNECLCPFCLVMLLRYIIAWRKNFEIEVVVLWMWNFWWFHKDDTLKTHPQLMYNFHVAKRLLKDFKGTKDIFKGMTVGCCGFKSKMFAFRMILTITDMFIVWAWSSILIQTLFSLTMQC